MRLACSMHGGRHYCRRLAKVSQGGRRRATQVPSRGWKPARLSKGPRSTSSPPPSVPRTSSDSLLVSQARAATTHPGRSKNLAAQPSCHRRPPPPGRRLMGAAFSGESRRLREVESMMEQASDVRDERLAVWKAARDRSAFDEACCCMIFIGALLDERDALRARQGGLLAAPLMRTQHLQACMPRACCLTVGCQRIRAASAAAGPLLSIQLSCRLPSPCICFLVRCSCKGARGA